MYLERWFRRPLPSVAEQDARGREWDAARQIAFLPAATGTLGLASAPCLRAAAAAGDRLLTEGWGARPEWDDLLRGAHTLSLQSLEIGFMAGRSRELAYSTSPIASASSTACRRVPELCCAPRRARMPASGCEPSPRTRAHSHTAPALLLPMDMQVALRRRFRLPLPFASARCGGHGEPGCRGVVDQLVDHRAGSRRRRRGGGPGADSASSYCEPWKSKPVIVFDAKHWGDKNMEGVTVQRSLGVSRFVTYHAAQIWHT